MNETYKTKKIWTDFEKKILTGDGIDIGCGNDPVFTGVTPFDIKHGDANQITKYVRKQFDFVYSSHCLEHMKDTEKAIIEWWKLVKPGGHLFLIVPDEDLYEQGFFPSRFNPDHKATFTISKNRSWSPISINLLDLVSSLPDAILVKIELQDNNYNRRLLKHNPTFINNKLIRFCLKTICFGSEYRAKILLRWLEFQIAKKKIVDQTLLPDVLAQIQCVVKKTSISARASDV